MGRDKKGLKGKWIPQVGTRDSYNEMWLVYLVMGLYIKSQNEHMKSDRRKTSIFITENIISIYVNDNSKKV